MRANSVGQQGGVPEQKRECGWMIREPSLPPDLRIHTHASRAQGAGNCCVCALRACPCVRTRARGCSAVTGCAAVAQKHWLTSPRKRHGFGDGRFGGGDERATNECALADQDSQRQARVWTGYGQEENLTIEQLRCTWNSFALLDTFVRPCQTMLLAERITSCSLWRESRERRSAHLPSFLSPSQIPNTSLRILVDEESRRR